MAKISYNSESVPSILTPIESNGGKLGVAKASKSEVLSFTLRHPRNSLFEK